MENVKKRTFVTNVCDEYGVTDELVRYPLMTAKEAYAYAKVMGGEWSVDVFAPSFMKLDILQRDEASEGNWYYALQGNSDTPNVISLALDITDDYYQLAYDGFSKNVLTKAHECHSMLIASGFGFEDVLYFKKEDGKYFLMKGKEKHGYLDGKVDSDLIFKDMLSTIFKETGIGFEVIIFPVSGTSFIFEDTLIGYQTVEDFEKALNSMFYSL